MTVRILTKCTATHCVVVLLCVVFFIFLTTRATWTDTVVVVQPEGGVFLRDGVYNEGVEMADTTTSRTVEAGSEDKFDLRLVHESLKKCLGPSNIIDTDCYLRAYNELYRFMLLLGKVFKFVASDVIEKVTILEIHRKSGAGSNYTTIQSMIGYEVSNKITVVKGYPPSGARTLLRLHRALVFLQRFMRRVADMPSDEKLSTMASEVYYETLAHHHAWVVRKAFDVAVYMLPTRRHLLEKMCKECDENMMETLLHEICDMIQPIYDETQRLYEVNDLLNLP